MSISSLSTQVLRVSGGWKLEQRGGSLGSGTCSQAQVWVAMVPSCRQQGFISICCHSSCLVGSRKRKKSCVCILMAAGSLNTVSGKDKEKVVRDRESHQDGDKLLWNVLNPTWTFYGHDALMNKHSSPQHFFLFFFFSFFAQVG